jgi:hypothetical protein
MLKRLKPFPIPTIHPVPEYLASPELKKVYEETKSILQVPWMGVVTMAFAHYPTFFNTLWSGLKELAESHEFNFSCVALRNYTEASAVNLSPSSIIEPLIKMGYAEKEITNILALNEVFSHGNMPYLMIATAARFLLEGNELSAKRDVSYFTGRHGPASENHLTLLEPHHVDQTTTDIYTDIKLKLGLPFLNTDYRAFARWPSYFKTAWGDLSTSTPLPEYESQVSAVHNFAVEQMLNLPNPKSLKSKDLQNAAIKDASLEEVLEVVRLFQWLLPGLAINVAFFRAQLSS